MSTVPAHDHGREPHRSRFSDQPPSYQLEIEGDGDEAVAGKVVEVHYVGVSWKNGKEFDASWDRGGTFSSASARTQVIKC
jgi:peptidylprolyl isomerase